MMNPTPPHPVALPAVVGRQPISITIVGTSMIGLGLALTGMVSGLSIGAEIWLGSLGLSATAFGCAQLATAHSDRQARSYLLLGYLWPVSTMFTLGIASLAWTSELRSFAVRQSDIPGALLIASLGIVAWTIGYAVANAMPITQGLARLIRVPLGLGRPGRELVARPGRVLAVYGATLAARLFLLSATQFGYLAGADITTTNPALNALRVVATLGPALLYLFAVETLDNPTPRARLALVLFVVTEVGIGLYSGGKQSAIVALVAVGLALRSRGQLTALKACLAASFVLFLIFPLIGEYRSQVRPIDGPRAGPAVLFAESVNGVLGDASSEPIAHAELALEDATQRVRYVDSIAAVANYVERRGTDHPSQVFRRAALLAVPRVLWPGKPVDTRSGDITQEIFLAPAGVRSSSAITQVGDAYLHGGLLGLFIFLPLIGVLACLLDTAFDVRLSDLLMVPFLLVLPTFIKAEADLANSLIGFVRTIALSAPLLWLLVGRASVTAATRGVESAAGAQGTTDPVKSMRLNGQGSP